VLHFKLEFTNMESFKKNLALVFDDDLKTRPYKWNNYIDFVIIAMILLSTVSVFLGTFHLSEGFRKGLNIADWIFQIFFTIEVSLRIWSADEIDPKYKGVWGRVRYCLSFYGLLDFISTYPLWFGFGFFRVLRVVRIFRVFRYMNAFRFLGEAFRSKKKELLVSLEFLTVITIALSFILYLVEHEVNPEIGDGWKSIVWAFAKYIGDPGKVADMPLVTPAGQVIAFLVGILGIAIFAVPIGLLSSGFLDAMDQEKRAEELKDFLGRMRTAFRRGGNKGLREYLNTLPDGGGDRFKVINVVPQRRPVSHLQVTRGMTLDDIIETCNEYDAFRLKNLTAALSDEELAADRFIVEHFPLNRPYGCCINRGSKVTIVCPTGYSEVGIGWFCYYLAKFGGFNYICKEIEAESSEPDSFFNLSPKPLDVQKANREAFLKDLDTTASKWVIIIVEHLKDSVNQVDFHFSDARKDGSAVTVVDQVAYKAFAELFATDMKEQFDLETVTCSKRYPLLKKNLAYTLQQTHPETNTFVLRPSSELINFNSSNLAIAFRIAQLLSDQFDDGRGITETDLADLNAKKIGYRI